MAIFVSSSSGFTSGNYLGEVPDDFGRTLGCTGHLALCLRIKMIGNGERRRWNRLCLEKRTPGRFGVSLELSFCLLCCRKSLRIKHFQALVPGR